MSASAGDVGTRIRSSGFQLMLAVLVALCGGPAHAADLVCSTPTPSSSPTTYDNVTIQSGCVLTVDTTACACVRSNGAPRMSEVCP
jgi:hypothetical protein